MEMEIVREIVLLRGVLEDDESVTGSVVMIWKERVVMDCKDNH